MPRSPRPSAATRGRPFTFVQISDSHIGFNKPPNADARATFREAIAKVKALPVQPDFIIHTGDVSQLSRDDEFDDAEQMLKATGLPVFFVPGEHDMLDPDGGKAFLNRFGKGTPGRRLVQLRPSRRALRRAGQRRRPEAGRHGQSRRRAAQLAEGGPRRTARHRRRSSSSPISRCGRSMPSGAGAPTIPPKR